MGIQARRHLRGVAAQDTRICMEATGPYSEASATHCLMRAGVVSVVNPAGVKGCAQGEMLRGGAGVQI